MGYMSDALLITVLGIMVVFSGLVLTALLIASFALTGKKKKKAPAQAVAAVEPRPEEPAPNKPLPADVLAVIAAVLEVELRLTLGVDESRFTFR